MHPYEWGILGIKALDFYPIFGCADRSHCSCCCGGFCGGIGYQSSAVASAIDENLEDAIDAGELTSAELLAAVGEAQFAEFKRLVSRTGKR